MTEDMIKKVQIFIQKYHMIEEGDRVLVGVSGGADSVCLLLVLRELAKQMRFSLMAVHVEHGIRGEESLQDAVFAESLCDRLGVPCLRYTVNVPEYAAQTRQTLEEAARALRYDCFRQACLAENANKAAVAHHGNDCAETMLFHLARGSGIRGLAGIAPVREWESITIIRPLLCLTRQEIEDWLDDCEQPYCIDSTNEDMAYSRNRIRSQVLPLMTEINRQAVTHMKKTAEQLWEVSDYLDQAALAEGEKNCEIHYKGDALKREKGSGIAQIGIRREGFLKMHPVLQSNLLHQMIGKMIGSRKDITSGHVEQVQELFFQGTGKQVSLPGGMIAVRTYDGVKLCPANENRPKKSDSFCWDLPVPCEMILENGWSIRTEILEFDGNFKKIPQKRYTKWFDYDKIKVNVQIRNWQSGDYFQADAAGSHKKLNRYFIDTRIPAEQRNQMMLLADGSHILWVIGYRISEFYKVTEQTRRILSIQCRINGGSDDRENKCDVYGRAGSDKD